MALSRQTIFDDLYSRLQAVSGVVTLSRRMRDFSQVSFSEQPAVFMVVGDQDGSQDDPGMPTKWRLSVVLYALVHDSGSDGPEPMLSGLVDRIEAAVEGERPGASYSCRVTKVEIGVGAQDSDQGAAVIDVEILAVA